MRRTLTVCCSLALIAGCFYNPKMPTEWGPLQSATAECPIIAGSYRNIGEQASEEKATAATVSELYSFFPGLSRFFSGLPGQSPVDRVEVSEPSSGVLDVSLWQGTYLHTKTSFSSQKGEFTCRDGELQLPSERWGDSGGGVGVAGSTSISFSRGADGSLIVKQHGSAFGVAVVIPFAISNTFWYRFGPWEK
jgi:hypothetical protein